MRKQYRYTLEKSSKKHSCPKCRKKRFVRYVDTLNNNYLQDDYGRCDREANCAYHKNPYNDNYLKEVWQQEQAIQNNWKRKHQKPVKKMMSKTTFIPLDVLKRTCSDYEKNVFMQNLLCNVAYPFEVQDVERVIAQYYLGTIKKGYRAGAVTFPFIDVNSNIRTIQVKQFDKLNHTIGTDFLHSILAKHYKQINKPLPKWLNGYLKNDTKVSCLFGEHLLHKYPHNPIALVEAPKTAIYGTLYFGFPKAAQNLLWLAVYNLSSLNLKKCKVLKGRAVYLFPDLSKDGIAFNLWTEKANQIQRRLEGTYFKVSDLLEQFAPANDKINGYDIADYLIKLDWRLFRKHCSKNALENNLPEMPTGVKGEKSVVIKKTIFFN